LAHLTDTIDRGGSTLVIRTDQREDPRAMVVTIATRDGKLLATWRTVFTPELRAREPAAVEELLAAQHLEVLEHAGLGAFDPVLGAEAKPAPPSPPAPSTRSEAPAPKAKPAIYSHPAFDGLPMLDGQYGEAELELDLPAGEASASTPAPVLATVPSEELRTVERMTEVGVGEVGPVSPPLSVPAARAPQVEAFAPPREARPPQREGRSPSAVYDLGAQSTSPSRPKRPSLPAAPVVKLEDLSPDKKPR
jgi:hypothetical protein